jgi:hypothetical protein
MCVEDRKLVKVTSRVYPGSMKPQWSDTTAEADEAHMRLYRAMGPARRAAVGVSMSDDARELTRTGIRRRHPEYSHSQVEDALRLLTLGPELFQAAWPARPLLKP